MGKRQEPVPSYMQTIFKARELMDKGVNPTDPEFEAKYPILWSVLTDTHMAEDKLADPAALRVYNSAGDWVFAVSSPGVGGSCEVAVATWPEGLPALEAKLGKGPEAWHFWKKVPPKIRKNGKPDEKV